MNSVLSPAKIEVAKHCEESNITDVQEEAKLLSTIKREESIITAMIVEKQRVDDIKPDVARVKVQNCEKNSFLDLSELTDCEKNEEMARDEEKHGHFRGSEPTNPSNQGKETYITRIIDACHINRVSPFLEGEKGMLDNETPGRQRKTECNRREHQPTPSCEKRFSCGECSFKTKYRGNLNTHMRVHDRKRPYPCKICPFAARYPSNLKKHVANVHAIRRCHLCSFNCSAISDLAAHMRTHLAEKPSPIQESASCHLEQPA